MAIESKNLLVWVKAMSRGQALPLDASEVWETKAEAEAYAAGIANSSTVAYVGQTLKVKENGTVTSYVIKDANGTLIRLADADAVDAAGKLSTARTISLTGDATGFTTFDGSADVSITVAIKDNSHSHSNYLTAVPSEYITETELNAKGYQTSSQVTAAIDAALANVVRAETVAF